VAVKVLQPFPADDGIVGHRRELEMRSHFKLHLPLKGDLYAVA
jgi:hypothetical protein